MGERATDTAGPERGPEIAKGLAGLAAIAASELALARVTGGPVPPEALLAALGLALLLGAASVLAVRIGLPPGAVFAPLPFLYGGWLWAAPALERDDALTIGVAWGVVLLVGAGVGWRRGEVATPRAGLGVFALLCVAAWVEIALRTEDLPPLALAGAALGVLVGGLVLGRAAVALAALALVPSLTPEPWTADAPPRPLPDVLLVSVDTLRYDEARRMTSFREVAGQGVFYRAQAPAPWTLPSLATLLTGLEPPTHGALRLPDGIAGLPTTVKTLAETLGELGYDTAATVHTPFAQPVFGLRQGFARFRAESVDPWVSPGTASSDRARPLGAVVATALGLPAEPARGLEARVADARALAGARRERPLFLWVHFLDPHVPYRHAGSLDLPRAERRMLETARWADLPERPDREMLDLLRRAHQNEVRAVDLGIQQLLRSIAPGPHGRIVILTSDHGEEFGEHGGWEHGHSLYQELLEIPLVVSGIPGLAPGDAGLVDVVPTLLGHLGVPERAPERTGRDLRRRAAAAAYRSGNPLYGDLNRWAVKRGPLKLFTDGSRREFYDLRIDPSEHHPRAGAGDEGAALLRLVSLDGAAETLATPLDAETRNALEALGYTLGGDEADRRAADRR